MCFLFAGGAARPLELGTGAGGANQFVRGFRGVAWEFLKTPRAGSRTTAARRGRGLAASVPTQHTRRVIRLIRDIHESDRASGRPSFSAEFFPPKTDEGERRLFAEVIPALLRLPIGYCSVTYGAGGTTREKTLGIVDRIQRDHDFTCMMHLTCVGATQDEIAGVVAEARSRGVRNILALRGDPPPGSGEFVRTEGGFEFSGQLVRYLSGSPDLCIGTAGFPEGHVAQKDGKHVDWGFLAEKIRAGADFVVTQLFFDNDDYYRFRDHLTGKLRIDVPLVPGLLPVLARAQTKKFVELCGAKLPAPFLAKLEALGDDDAAVTAYGIDYCSAQVEDLLASGAPGAHFYTLNKAHSTAGILKNLGY